MIINRLHWLILLLIPLLFVLGACKAAENIVQDIPVLKLEENPVPLALSVLRLTMSSGAASGNYYSFGAALAKVVGDTSNYLVLDVQPSEGYIENIERLASEEAQLALAPNDMLFYAYHATDTWQEKPPLTTLAPLMTLYPEVCQLVVRANSPLTAVKNLKGKRVAIGEDGTAQHAGALHILEEYGLAEDDLELLPLGFAEAAQALQEKTIDAFFVTVGTPNKGMMDLFAAREIAILSLEEEKIEKLLEKYPFYTRYTLDENDYSFLTEPVNTVAIRVTLAATTALSEQAAYDLVKTIIENNYKIAVVNAKGMYIKAEEAVQGLPLKLHPGAQRYFAEIGAVKEAAEEAPPEDAEADTDVVIE